MTITAPFPSDEWFSTLVAQATSDAAALERLGIADLRFGVEVIEPNGTVRLFGIIFDGFDVTSVGEVTEVDFAPEAIVSGPMVAWVEMIGSIEALGHADGAHSLNSLTIFGTPLVLRASDPMGHDKFFRFMGTIQELFDQAGRSAASIGG